jgi:hypothetical protein
MNKIILTLTLALLPLALPTPAHAKSCGVYRVVHTSGVTHKTTTRSIYRCSGK